MKKITSLLMIILVSFMTGILSIKAIVKECPYSGEWDAAGTLYSEKTGKISVTLRIDTELYDKSQDDVFVLNQENAKNGPLTIQVLNFYHENGPTFLIENTFGDINDLSKEHIGTAAQYVARTNSCPQYLDLLDWNNGQDMYAVIASNSYYKNKSGNKVAARLESSVLNYEELQQQLLEACSYKFTTKENGDSEAILYRFKDGSITMSNNVIPINSSDFNGNCPQTAYICSVPRYIVPGSVGGGTDYYIAVSKDSMYSLDKKDEGIYYRIQRFQWSGSADKLETNLRENSIECSEVTKGVGDINKLGASGCQIIDKIIYDVRHAYNSDNMSANNQITTFCTSYLKNMNYSNDICMQKCLNLNELYPDVFTNKGNKCGFSDKLLAWIMNIMRWIKYLVPVLLIVLSIMDFIKALSSDKEDEMKKAQKHFVTRLIVAALIFIAPLIIEFILDKMGFGIENCGIENIGLGK